MTNPLRYLYKKMRRGFRRPAAAPAFAYPADRRHGMAVNRTPYRTDFYIPANIIGYAGTLNNAPTVFFMRGTEYGHIVQFDTDADNIGREKLDDYSEVAGTGYVIRTENLNGGMVTVERFIFSTTHRLSPPVGIHYGTFTDLRQQSPAQRLLAVPLLAQSIRTFSEQKLKWENHG